MALPETVTVRNRVVLWEKLPMRCTCHRLMNAHVEIRLAVNEIEIHRERFADTEAAARFAIAKMRAYDAS